MFIFNMITYFLSEYSHKIFEVKRYLNDLIEWIDLIKILIHLEIFLQKTSLIIRKKQLGYLDSKPKN